MNQRLKNTLLTIGMLIVAIFLGYKIYTIAKEVSILNKENDELTKKIETIDKENKKTQEDINYYSIPQNLEKLFKERLNYKKPEEKMMIIIQNE